MRTSQTAERAPFVDLSHRTHIYPYRHTHTHTHTYIHTLRRNSTERERESWTKTVGICRHEFIELYLHMNRSRVKTSTMNEINLNNLDSDTRFSLVLFAVYVVLFSFSLFHLIFSFLFLAFLLHHRRRHLLHHLLLNLSI
jgi:hypothetical protein